MNTEIGESYSVVPVMAAGMQQECSKHSLNTLQGQA